jgi:integrase
VVLVTAKRPFGQIDPLPSGRFRARYMHHGVRYAAPDTFLTYGDADYWLAEEQVRTRRPNWTPPDERALERGKTLTVEAVIRADIAKRVEEGTIGDRTRQGYEDSLRLYIRPTFGTRPLAELTSGAVRGWYDDLVHVPTSRARAYELLSSVTRKAHEGGLIETNPCKIKNGTKVVRATVTNIATVDEIALLVKNMPDRLQAVVLIAGWMGLRFGELVELRRKDVDLKRNQLSVRRAVVRLRREEGEPEVVLDDGTRVPGGKRKVKPPKSLERILPMPEHLAEALAEHLERHVGPRPDALLFPATNDPTKHLAPGTWHKRWDKARRAVDRPDLRLHDLRHTAGTRFTQRGATLKEVMALLGHATPVAAMRYQQVAADRMDSLMRKMDPKFMD